MAARLGSLSHLVVHSLNCLSAQVGFGLKHALTLSTCSSVSIYSSNQAFPYNYTGAPADLHALRCHTAPGFGSGCARVTWFDSLS